jgi:hypothetical protein
VLTEIEPRKIEKALETLPKDLDSAYQLIMNRLENRGKGVRDLALRTILWISKAVRPLRMDELRDLLVVEKGDTDLRHDDRVDSQVIVDACESLVVLDESGEFVQFTHYSAQEYLQLHYGLLPPVSDLADTCLTYLAFETFAKGPCQDDDSLSERLKEYPASSYVAKFWGHHVKAAQGDPGIHKTVLDVIASEKTRNSMLQMAQHRSPFRKGQTLLHIIAERGLSKTCRLVLDTMSQNMDA